MNVITDQDSFIDLKYHDGYTYGRTYRYCGNILHIGCAGYTYLLH